MSDFSIVAVAIGLIFTYFILSILATSISTLINQIANTRARNLKAELKDFLGDGEFSEEFFSHPLINLSVPDPSAAPKTPTQFRFPLLDNLRQRTGSADYLRFRKRNTTGKLVGGAVGAVFGWLANETVIWHISWIISRLLNEPIINGIANSLLAPTVFGRVISALICAVIGAVLGGLIVKLIYVRFRKSLTDFSNTTRVDSITKEVFADVVSELVTQKGGTDHVADPPQKTLKKLSKGIDDLLPERLKQWFTQWATNSTASYRRRQSVFAFFIGLMLALAVNADTLQIARALFSDNELRDAVNIRVNQYLDATPEPTSEPTAEATEVATPEIVPTVEVTPEATLEPATNVQTRNIAFSAAQATEEPATSEAAPPPEPEDAGGSDPSSGQGDSANEIDSVSSEAIAGALKAADQLIEVGLPIGWEYTPVSLPPEFVGGCFSDIGRALPECDNTRNLWLFQEGNSPNLGSLVFRKVIGILLTAIAIAQGAPFWFDLLNRLTGRTAAKKSEGEG